jgi:hypothetical protein
MPLAEELSGKVWPVHPKPLPDELLSSWMVRIARACGSPPRWFWTQFWPGSKLSFRQLDHVVGPGLFELLVEKIGVTPDTVLNTTLLPFVSIDRILFRSGNARFCPACLSQDVTPYFRRRWIVQHVVACDLHSTLLLPQCTECKHRLRPERVPLEADSIAFCYFCAQDLRQQKSRRIPNTRNMFRFMRFQERLLTVLDGQSDYGTVTIPRSLPL